MVLRIILAVLVMNLLLALFILLSDRSRKEKAIWTTILLAIPLVALGVYQILSRRQKKGPGIPKDWESR